MFLSRCKSSTAKRIVLPLQCPLIEKSRIRMTFFLAVKGRQFYKYPNTRMSLGQFISKGVRQSRRISKHFLFVNVWPILYFSKKKKSSAKFIAIYTGVTKKIRARKKKAKHTKMNTSRKFKLCSSFFYL